MAVTYVHNKFYALKTSDFIKAGKETKSLDLNLMTPKKFYVDLSEFSTNKEDEEVIAKLHEMAGKSLLFRTDLYRPIPTDRSEMESIFQYNSQPRHPDHWESCITVDILTAYHSGLVCYDLEKHQLVSFVNKDSLATPAN